MPAKDLRPFDAAEHLTTAQECAAYLRDIAEAGNAEQTASAAMDVARALEKMPAPGQCLVQIAEPAAAAPQAPAAPAMPYTHVTPDCEDAGLLWAEIHHLRAAVQGPDGFASWQEAATAERVKRVAAERVAAGLPAVPTPWLPYLSDRADGVRGHYAIARHNPAGYREVWNLRTHQWASASDEVLTIDEALALLQKLTIPTAAPAAPAVDAAPVDSIGAIVGDLLQSHARTTKGEWQQGDTSHDTIAKRDGEDDYKVASFRHACDAQFVDVAHKYLPQVLAHMAHLEAEVQRLKAVPAAPAAPWKDHNTARLVNDLRDIARQYHAAGQLRERIAHLVAPLCAQLKAAEAAAKAPAVDAPGLLLTVIQRLNQNPYSLTKSECIREVEAMREAAIAAQATAKAPAAPAEAADKAHVWRHSASYGGDICAECGAAKGSRRGNAQCAQPPSPAQTKEGGAA